MFRRWAFRDNGNLPSVVMDQIVKQMGIVLENKFNQHVSLGRNVIGNFRDTRKQIELNLIK